MLLGVVSVGMVPAYAEGTVPTTTEQTTPQEETTPTEETVPSETTPEETVPEETVPEETVPEEPGILTASANCISVLKAEEGFSKTPYWDFTQYTVGYGTRCPEEMVAYYTQNGITEAEAETLLRNHLAGIEHDIHTRIINKYGLELTQNQFDALVLFSYNCGTAWAYEVGGTFHQAIATGATGNDLIRAFALWCSAGNQIRTFLLRRRLSQYGEARTGMLLAIQRADLIATGTRTAEEASYYNDVEEILNALLAEDQCFQIRDLAVNGNDLMALGLKGKAIGQTLQKLLNLVIEEQVPNEREALLESIK